MSTLNRREHGRPAAPVRIIHLGIGNFTRAHQAWYTEAASDADQWGIAGFAGRTTLEPRPSARDDALDAQEGLYQLCIQKPEGDDVQVISSVSRTYRSHEIEPWITLFADPNVAIVSSTITEAGYCRDIKGDLDLDQVREDLDLLKTGDLHAAVFTGPAKFVRGLMARRKADAGPITFVPCDNIPANGSMAQRIVRQAAEYVDPSLVDWIDKNVSFVTTMVDRITPRATDEDRARVSQATGIDDPGLVVTEPFSEWVLSGEFKAGHPDWESAGARFVDDIKPHEMRKLFLLNGSHSLMAYCAPILGHKTVYDAIRDERVRAWVENYWAEARSAVPLPAEETEQYCRELIERYENPRMRDQLARIAADGTQKLPIRIVPTIKLMADNGAVSQGASRVIAGWILHLRGLGAPVDDANLGLVAGADQGSLEESVSTVMRFLEIDDEAVSQRVLALAHELKDAAGE